ncbi:phosphopantothenoylcysteine decarboxylase subunit VHS3-like [Senna tora]|uniref:Phosphopantothenoylcysteine decarboxylase subunit VHS3-like n=1 Tax=Senna tora TaxID=362788 RepID=A0A834X538_9FABA|nr:phosphopantothenoylcysteine decarboxylase subunit VHS3-like [Senna tora]
MEVRILSSMDTTMWIGSLLEALAAEAFLATTKSLACLLLMVMLPIPLWSKDTVKCFDLIYAIHWKSISSSSSTSYASMYCVGRIGL